MTMDDDLQHPPELLPELIERIEQGFDLVYAVSRGAGRSVLLRAGTWINDIFFTLFLRKPSSIEIGSYRIMSRVLVDRIRDVRTNFVYVSALIFRSTPQPLVQSFRFEQTVATLRNQSRINISKRFRLFAKLFAYYGPFRFIIRLIQKRGGDPFPIERIL